MDLKPLIERAAKQATALVDGVGAGALAPVAEQPGTGADMLRCLLTHELVAGHTVMMRLAAKIDHFLALIAADLPADEQDRGCRQAVQLSGAAARLTERYRLGVMSLARLERRNAAAHKRPRLADELDDDLDDDDPFDGSPRGGRRKSPAKRLAELAALNKAMAAMLDGAKPDAAKPNGTGNGPQLEPAPNRGRLRHGNPSGDFLAAPRCGARTRAGCPCRQPAMANGRCRLHGGKSTGACTAAGLARCRTARLVHGERTAEIIDLRAAAARHGRNLRHLTRLVPAVRTAKPQSERSTPCPATPRLANTGAGQVPPVPSTIDVGAAPRGRPLVPPHGRPHGGAPTSELDSERTTPCPATIPALSPTQRRNVGAVVRGAILSRRRKIAACS